MSKMYLFLGLAIVCLIGNVIFMFLAGKEGRKKALEQTEKNLVETFNNLDSVSRAKFIANANLNKKEIIFQINNKTKNSATEIITEVKSSFGIIEEDLKEKEQQIVKLKNSYKLLELENENLLLKINNSEKELKNQKEEIVAVRDFSDIAKKNVYGGEFTYPNSGNTVLETGPIIENMFKVFKHINGNPDLVFSDESLNAAKYVIEIEPRFPFSYYAVARILRHRKDKEWKDYAEQAIAILEKTTKIKKHSDHHRQVLEQLNGFLSE